ncbi:Outer membrane protein TolC [Bacteroides faecichinchillae]|uniref:Outer membrane protein TolC n=2 Tax=Bacteroides faecichinchillae TaxID=871325 RepID=A0A1M4WWK0_9BACE|nr:TolC family protein [Bacteroides faecichinchillae]THG68798.1 TolC family protein [Bacteroides faecichinchillae]SHE85624.1 Outer membrane protein TolC [Bacteroides faecichinchillae]
MKKNQLIFVLFALCFLSNQMKAQTSLSFKESLHLLQQGNQSLKIADKSIEIAKTERDKLNAFWYPSLQSTGAFVHMSEKIEVKQPLSQFTDPAKDFVHSIIPNDQIISSILDQIGTNTLIFPLTPRNLTTVDVSAEWVLFSGGKRFRATNIGRTMVDLARENRAEVSANQQNLLVESYYGLRLAQQIVTVREETYKGLQKHYENALKLEAAGMIDKAGRLFAQVNMDEARRELEAAQKEETVMQSALKTLLNKKDMDENIVPTSPLFMNDSLPPKMLFNLSVGSGNYLLNQLQLQEHIAKQQVRIDQSGYLPNIAIFGKQTLYSHGIQSNLVPRTMVGIGFTWNLFDGLDREKRIRQSKLTQQTLVLRQMKARDDLAVGVDKLYTQLQKAQDNVKALNATIKLSEELVRIRKKSFTEGMATSTEVIDAETMLSKVKVARLAAYYEYDVALMNLLSLCGTPEQFVNYQPKP